MTENLNKKNPDSTNRDISITDPLKKTIRCSLYNYLKRTYRHIPLEGVMHITGIFSLLAIK